MGNNKENILHKIFILKALETDIQENKNINKTEAYRRTRWKIEKVSRKKSMLHFLNRVAAIFILPLLISTMILSYILLEEKEEGSVSVPFTEVTALPGMIVRAQLSDSSEVWLNSESTLRYPVRFSSGKRTVSLTGEAFFEVRNNPEHPFEVNTSDGITVMARGTSFNVNAYPEDRVTEAVLQEGIIDIHYKGNHISVAPDEMISIDKVSELFKRSCINIQEKTGWKDGLLIFRNTPLDEVLKKISRRYNVEIVLHRETNEDYRVRATFSSETLPQILDILKIAAPIRWSIKEIHQNSDLTYSRQKIDVWIK
jgi:ferric-dicitrate binding protein FerR (iron transport regulator)